MKKPVKKLIHIEKNDKLVDRVLLLSMPSALVFIMLVALRILPPMMAVISYATITIFNIAFLFPLTSEMQKLKNYIATLAQGEDVSSKDLKMSEKETKDLIEAVNAMHRFWAHKTDVLEAQTVSDTAVLDSLPDPIIMIDRAGNILGANSSARGLFGKNVTDKNVEKVFDSKNFLEAVSEVLKKEYDAKNLVFYAKKPLDKKLYAHIKELPFISRGRAVAVIAFYDLTKTMKIEKMQSDFVANASHELRTPLSIISGFIETLQTSAKDDEQARENFLKVMATQTEYMSSLIENLLSLSKIEMSQDQKPDEKVFVPNIIDDVIEALRIKADDREIKLTADVEKDVSDIVADARQVKQIVQNLTDNAIKYGTAKTAVTIRAKLVESIPASKTFQVKEGGGVAISINNKGAKISNENMARLTERFYRMQEHKDLNIKGTGLGLAIAKQIVMRHHGNLTLTSNAYNGTTFTIYLPIEQ